MARRDRAARPWRNWRDALFLVLTVAVCAIVATTPAASRLTWLAFDTLLLATAAPVSDEVTVIDIDDASLMAKGSWPWPKSLLAELVDKVATSKPAVIAIDMLLLPGRAGCSSHNQHGPPNIEEERLLQSFSAAPVVVAALLDNRRTRELPFSTPIIVTDPQPRLKPWFAAGFRLPPDSLVEAAAGMGVASLAADADGIVRTVPLLAAAGESALPGFAVEAIRVVEDASAIMLSALPDKMQIAEKTVEMTKAANLRFFPSTPNAQARRTIAAKDVLSGAVSTRLLAGRIILIGGSAADLGALWSTAAGPLIPSVQIHADAIETILEGSVPLRPDYGPRVEIMSLILMCGLAAWLGLKLAPLSALSFAAAFSGAWIVAVAIAFARERLLIDPVLPATCVMLAAGLTILISFGRGRREARHLRQRFEQHLAPAVVQRLIENVDSVKLQGERRTVTALFTDLEDFTATTERLELEVLIDLLDAYFAEVSAIVVRHGGMIDKIVGDAVHALFNAPFDLDDHPAKALDCAFEIVAFSEVFRCRPDIAPHALGRTRIGVESGQVVLGDVGRGAKLDYTAHGSAVNTAARLEGLNAYFGTAICVGPRCRALAGRHDFRSLGTIHVRGRGELEVFEPRAKTGPGSGAERDGHAGR